MLSLAGCGRAAPSESVSQKIVASTGGKVGESSSASVEIPPGALAADASVSVASRSASDLQAKDKKLASKVWSFRVNDQDAYTFQKEVTLRVPYDPALLPAGSKEQSLALAVWNAGHWETLPGSQVDTSARAAIAKVTHFSDYAVVQALAGAPPSRTNHTTAIARISAAFEGFGVVVDPKLTIDGAFFLSLYGEKPLPPPLHPANRFAGAFYAAGTDNVTLCFRYHPKQPRPSLDMFGPGWERVDFGGGNIGLLSPTAIGGEVDQPVGGVWGEVDLGERSVTVKVTKRGPPIKELHDGKDQDRVEAEGKRLFQEAKKQAIDIAKALLALDLN
jgi:hypothetical protein